MKPGFFIMERGIMRHGWDEWGSADPIGVRDGLNLFNYGHCNPVCFTDSKEPKTFRLLMSIEK